MPNRKLVHSFEKNGRGEQVQVAVQTYRGRQYIDVRTWFPDKTTGEMRPSQKGLAMNADQLAELLAGLQQAQTLVEGGHGRAQ